MKFDKDIATVDTETTGISVVKDRICSIAVSIIRTDGSKFQSYKELNPGIPIPAEATAVHGITDDQIKDAPQFIQIAKSLFGALKGCVILGHNSNDFDVVILAEEFARCGIIWPEPDQIFLDTFNIFRKEEPRDLKAAYKFYCDKEIQSAHNALGDVLTTEEVFTAQLERYPHLKEMSLTELAAYCQFGKRYDLAGKFVKDEEGHILFNFGKHIGKKAIDVFKKDKYYFKWMNESEFTSETLRIAKELYDFVHPPKVK